MGKKYYCDYCQKHIQRDPSIVRKHNEGIPHIRNRTAHYERCKDIKELLAETSRKKPCRTLLTSEQCSFGATCRYSHYRPEELRRLEQQASRLDNQKVKRATEITAKLDSAETIVQKFLTERSERDAKDSVEYKPFWSYEEDQQRNEELPPSLQEIDPSRIDSGRFSEWG